MSEFTTSQDRCPIPGYDGKYEIDKQGNVYAMFAFRGMNAGWKKKTRPNKDGYISVSLPNGSRYLHRLLMLTFNPIENSNEMEVNHIDLDKGNNDLKNLEWMTHQANIQHAHKFDAWAANGPRGENTITAKLTEGDVRQIRELYKAGHSQKAIGLQFGVTGPNISYIVRGKSWAHIK